MALQTEQEIKYIEYVHECIFNNLVPATMEQWQIERLLEKYPIDEVTEVYFGGN